MSKQKSIEIRAKQQTSNKIADELNRISGQVKSEWITSKYIASSRHVVSKKRQASSHRLVPIK
jgi:hypothetical protein